MAYPFHPTSLVHQHKVRLIVKMMAEVADDTVATGLEGFFPISDVSCAYMPGGMAIGKGQS